MLLKNKMKRKQRPESQKVRNYEDVKRNSSGPLALRLNGSAGFWDPHIAAILLYGGSSGFSDPAKL